MGLVEIFLWEVVVCSICVFVVSFLLTQCFSFFFIISGLGVTSSSFLPYIVESTEHGVERLYEDVGLEMQCIFLFEV